jgi:hypothetical protein
MNIFNGVYSFSNNYTETDTTPRIFATMNEVELTPTYTTNYARYTFTSTGKLFFTGIVTDISVIIVGGGGGGGTMLYDTALWDAGNGGGGGGGVGYGTLQISTNNILNITVGIGGTSLNVNNFILATNQGGNTTIYGRNISETAYGGGAGQCNSQYTSGLIFNDNCGSGGGGCFMWQTYTMVGGTASRGIGNKLTYFGNSGGSAIARQKGGGGGGGASAPGNNNNVGVIGVGGNGGNGISIMVDNTMYGMYGSGGGGGNSSTGLATKGGSAGSSIGGGTGGGNSTPVGIDASNNSGCGGGGASGAKTKPQYVGGKGGSGICIIFVPISAIPLPS